MLLIPIFAQVQIVDPADLRVGDMLLIPVFAQVICPGSLSGDGSPLHSC
jgi:hypothetical protein